MQDETNRSITGGISQLLFMVSGIVAIVFGLIGSSFGSAWSARAFEYFAGIELMEIIGTYAPFFPFVPFFPIFTIMLGALLIVKSRQ